MILPIAEYTVKENIRGKIFYILLMFILVMVGAALVFSSLSPDTEARVITDIGLACIELFSFMAGIFAAVNLVLQEIENRTIYLLMTRPLHRWEYILGRYLGVLVILFINILLMLSVLVLLLKFASNWQWDAMLFWSVITIFFKLIIIVSVALTASLVFTSTVTAIAFSFMVWIIGHFSNELRILSDKVTAPVTKVFLSALYYLVPNFQYLNLKDKLYIPEVMPMHIIALVLLYSLVYTAIVLFIGNLLFSRKEF
jgi:ABC-type transport system involved in multi-copper enzyme maturation permease subunit